MESGGERQEPARNGEQLWSDAEASVSPAGAELVREQLDKAAYVLELLDDRIIDVLSIRKPLDANEALGWSRIVSKLSPLLGNLMEFEIVRLFNDELDLPQGCKWVRLDPGFPDAALEGLSEPPPGIELKAWFPLATEITGRFRESQVRLLDGSIRLAVVCWLPEYFVFGRPKVLGTWIEDGLGVARSRDDHYYQPPHYLVREPGDTSARTANLQQTVTNGFRLQETGARLQEAVTEVAGWSAELRSYSHEADVQGAIADLMARYTYRLDTNFAKIDRVDHPSLERFKTRMLRLSLHGRTVAQWSRLLSRTPEAGANAIMELARRAPD
jgi:hypothetical protein